MCFSLLTLKNTIYKKQIVYKKTDEWYNEWQRVTTSGTTSDNEWQRVVKSRLFIKRQTSDTSSNKVVQQETMSNNVWQWVTTNDNDNNKWKQMTTSDSEWLIFLFWNNRGTYHYTL